ncbi:MAG: HEAT repeat domain-containing protein, partial [Caldilineaceae bacterium]
MIEQRRAEADALAQQILAAASPHEEMLHRDLFLAAALAADDVGLGQTTTAHLLERLTPLIASPIPTVQKQSIQGIAHLARLGSLAASAALLTALADPNLLHPALQNCLPVLRAPQGREVRAAIVGKLDDDSWDVRIAAVGALGSLVGSEPEVRAAIVGKLDDDSWDVRIAAVDALLPLLPSDGEMAESLLPWLGMASQGRWNFSADRTSEDVLDDLVGLLAEGVAQSASLCQRIIHLLDARSAPARHRAARVLIAQPGGPPPELLPRLRGLLEDNRSEYRWPERLQVAELFLNHQDY